MFLCWSIFGNTTLQICWLVIFQGHGEDRAGRHSFVRCVFFQNLLFNNCFSAMSNVHALVPAATFCTVSDPICSILWFCTSWFIITLNALYLLGLLKCHSALCSRTTHFGNFWDTALSFDYRKYRVMSASLPSSFWRLVKTACLHCF